MPEIEELEAAGATMGLTIGDAAKRALEGLNQKLDAEARKAFDDGMDFAVGPLTQEHCDPFAVRDIFAPHKIEVECKAGPVSPGWSPPHGWRVYHRPEDWPCS
jgi:hypothetical protein